jgi:hypothetical protein
MRWIATRMVVVCLLLGGMCPDWAFAELICPSADLVQTAGAKPHGIKSPRLVTSGACSDADQLLMSMILMIGHVPCIALDPTGGGHHSGHGTLPGGSKSSGGDHVTPSETPEPATWLLAALGGGAVGGAWLRRRSRRRT